MNGILCGVLLPGTATNRVQKWWVLGRWDWCGNRFLKRCVVPLWRIGVFSRWLLLIHILWEYTSNKCMSYWHRVGYINSSGDRAWWNFIRPPTILLSDYKYQVLSYVLLRWLGDESQTYESRLSCGTPSNGRWFHQNQTWGSSSIITVPGTTVLPVVIFWSWNSNEYHGTVQVARMYSTTIYAYIYIYIYCRGTANIPRQLHVGRDLFNIFFSWGMEYIELLECPRCLLSLPSNWLIRWTDMQCLMQQYWRVCASTWSTITAWPFYPKPIVRIASLALRQYMQYDSNSSTYILQCRVLKYAVWESWWL